MIISNFSAVQPKFKRETVPVPELTQGDDVPEILLQEMSGGEQAEFQARMTKPEFKDKEDGSKLFSDESEATAFIDTVPAGVINRLNKAIWQLNNGQTEKNS